MSKLPEIEAEKILLSHGIDPRQIQITLYPNKLIKLVQDTYKLGRNADVMKTKHRHEKEKR